MEMEMGTERVEIKNVGGTDAEVKNEYKISKVFVTW